MLKKEYKFTPPKGEKPDSDGLTPTMIDFNWERDVAPGVSIYHSYSVLDRALNILILVNQN